VTCARVVACPSDDVLRVLDHRAVVEDEHGNEAFAGQSFDLPPASCDVGQCRETVGPHDVRRVAGVLQCVVGPLAWMRARAPRRRPSWPWHRERSPAHVELHDAGST